MHKKNQKIKKFLGSFVNFISLTLIILFSETAMVYGSNNDWVEVSKTPEGIQYIDRKALDNKGRGIIEVKTKYLKIDTNDSKKIDENIYIMRINCLTNKFKDISVNGKINLSAKWEGSNGDKLLDDVILDSCKNV